MEALPSIASKGNMEAEPVHGEAEEGGDEDIPRRLPRQLRRLPRRLPRRLHGGSNGGSLGDTLGRGTHTTGIVGRRQQRGAARSIASLTRSLAPRVAARAAQTNTTEPEEKSALPDSRKTQNTKHRATTAARSAG